MLHGTGNGQPVRAKQGEWHERLGRVERQIGIDRRRDRELSNRTDDQRIAVGGLALGVDNRELPGRAGPVLDDDRLAQGFRELRADDPRHQVIAAAGGKSDDDPDGLARIARRVFLGRCFTHERRGQRQNVNNKKRYAWEAARSH